MEGMNALGRSQIKSWNDAPADGASGQQALTTKDFDFGAPGVRKRFTKYILLINLEIQQQMFKLNMESMETRLQLKHLKMVIILQVTNLQQQMDGK